MNPWSVDLENPNESGVSYIDLAKNPERYTGYKGFEANKIWKAIYEENCFVFDIGRKLQVCENDQNVDKESIFKMEIEKCLEKRVFFKLLSGLHTSITAHIAYEYLLDHDLNSWVGIFCNTPILIQ